MGERFADVNFVDRVDHGGGGVMVWAGVCYGQRTQVHFINGILNAQRYRDKILRPIAVPFIHDHHLMLHSRTLEPRVGQPPAHSLGFKAYVSNQFPPVFSPQTGSGTESSGSESACGVLTPNSPESSLTRQTLSSPPPLRQAFKPINS